MTAMLQTITFSPVPIGGLTTGDFNEMDHKLCK